MDMQTKQMSEEEREEIISYGIKRGKVIFFSALSTIIMGCLLGIAWQSIIFLFCLSILRKYAGGYHADTEKQCYIISFIVVTVSLTCIKLFHYSGGWEIILQTISLLVILALAPVESKDHILDGTERKKYGFRTKIIAIMLFLMYAFLFLSDNQSVAISIGTANLVVALSLLAGYVKIKNCKKSIKI